MNSLTDLEEHIVQLHALSKASTKTLDAFADVSHSISVRAHQIYRDVKPWEVALENISGTIEEISKAARCYHAPPVLKPVLAERNTDPESISRCMDYLVYTSDYLGDHPPNEYGEVIAAQLQGQLDQIVNVGEKFIRKAFFNAISKQPGPARLFSKHIIKNEEALIGVPDVLGRLSQHFNRTSVVHLDVKHLLETALKNAIDTSVNTGYAEEDVPRNIVKTQTGSQPHLYHRGDHPLLRVSKEARQMVSEIAACIDKYIIRPMQDDFDVVDMPGDVAVKAFDIISDKARTAIHFDKGIFKDPTAMFLASRGQGVGLYPGVRSFRDIVFIALDMVEEMWGWKVLVNDLPGDNNASKDHVDEDVDHFMMLVRNLLDGYVDSTGGLVKERLIQRTQLSGETDWFPALDCTAHESSTNLLYFQKVLFSSYYGALKLVLLGSSIDSTSEYLASKEVEDYFSRCVSAHMNDIVTIAIAVEELLQSPEWKKRHKSKSSPYICTEIFVINNALFLSQSYRRAKCFLKRVIPAAPAEGLVAKEHVSSSAAPAMVVDTTLTLLEDMVSSNIDDFGLGWDNCIPALPKELLSLSSTERLKKSELNGFLQWYSRARASINERVAICKGGAVMDSVIRQQLMQGAYKAVEKRFMEATNVVESYKKFHDPLKSIFPLGQEELSKIAGLF